MKEKKPGKNKIKYFFLFLLIFVVAASTGGYAAFKYGFFAKSHYVKRQRPSVKTVKYVKNSNTADDDDETQEMETEEFITKDIYNILMVGVDKHDEYWDGNGDVVMLATINNDKKTIYLTSFLRDLYAELPGIGVRKLNAACANGGPEMTAEVLENTYGIKVDYYAMVDFNGMIDVVDALGGVDLEIDQEEMITANDYITCMCEDNDEDPEKHYIKDFGEVHLSGYQAVGYARNRYTGGGSDFGRVERQRKVLDAIFQKAKSGDLGSLKDAATAVMPYITHDIDELSMIEIILQLPKWSEYQILEQSIPYKNEYHSENEILIPNDMEATKARLRKTLYGC